MKSSIRLFKIAGIEIGIHYTWIFIFLLITWSLAVSSFPVQYPGWSTLTYWLTGAVAAIIVFISVLLHEMAHSLVARARGMKVDSITLFILGGVSNLEDEPEKPGTEFSMAIVGPLTSLVLAAIFWGLGFLVSDQTGVVYAVISYLAIINLFLGIFNLIPGFPMDGGRVLRSIIWGNTGDLKKATIIASWVGRAFSWLFIGIGVFLILRVDFISGLWLIFIGWFLGNAADASRVEITLRQHLSAIKVKSIMNFHPDTIEPDTSVDELVKNIFYSHHSRAVPVCSNEKLVGIVTITDVKKIPQHEWPVTKVEQIMTKEPLYTVSPEDTIQTVFKLIAKHDINQVLVNVEGQCNGLITRADIISYLELNQERPINQR